MANHHRGEVSLTLASGHFLLRLTLQALAEIETAFGAGDLEALGARFSGGRVSARDLVTLVGAAIRGGGQNLSDEEIAARIDAADLPAVAAALGRLFARSFGEESERPPVPRQV